MEGQVTQREAPTEVVGRTSSPPDPWPRLAPLVALRRPALLHRRGLPAANELPSPSPPPMSSLPHLVSSMWLTTPASRWPGSLPTDAPLRLAPIRVHHSWPPLRCDASFSRLTVRLADKRRFVSLSLSMRDSSTLKSKLDCFYNLYKYTTVRSKNKF
jgi:hypothetical protein